MNRMRRRCLFGTAVLIGIACGTGSGPPPVGPLQARGGRSPASRMQPSIPKSAPSATSATSATAGAAEPGPPSSLPEPPADIEPELASAPPWIGRIYATGLVRANESLESMELRRTAKRALLVIEKRSRLAARDGGQAGAWSQPSVERYIGDVKEAKPDGVDLTLKSQETTLKLSCATVQIKVAAASAKALGLLAARAWGLAARVTCLPEGNVCLLDRLKRVRLFRCTGRGDSSVELSFAAPPGVERVGVNDDQFMSGQFFRAIPKDGSVNDAFRAEPPR